jgi:hypothetical protein
VHDRSKVLAALIQHLPQELKHTAQNEAMNTAKAIRDEFCCSEVLATLAPHLTPMLVDEALNEATVMSDKYYRSEVLAALTRLLPS